MEIEKLRLMNYCVMHLNLFVQVPMFYVAKHVDIYSDYVNNNAIAIQQATNVSWATINKWYRINKLAYSRNRSHKAWFKKIINRAGGKLYYSLFFSYLCLFYKTFSL